MSWDASLHPGLPHSDCGRDELCEELRWWNYTHNTNRMIYGALDSDRGSHVRAWYLELLHGRSGPDGAAGLARILSGLRADPGRWRKLNPSNGWGDYDRLVQILTQMRDAALAFGEQPTHWSACG